MSKAWSTALLVKSSTAEFVRLDREHHLVDQVEQGDSGAADEHQRACSRPRGPAEGGRVEQEQQHERQRDHSKRREQTAGDQVEERDG